MVVTPSIDALRDALAPVEALRGEQSQLESWVRDSFAALDSLHGELTEWQRDVTRQQAALDQREAGLAESAELHDSELAARLEEQLARAREEASQLEDENAEQLQAIDDLDRQLAVAHAELRIVRKHSDELSVALETERERAADEHRHWTFELRELRRLMERQGAMLGQLSGQRVEPEAESAAAARAAATMSDDDEADGTDDVTARTAELRRRANSRRAHRRPL